MEVQLAAEGRDLYEKNIDVAHKAWQQEAMKAQLASEYQKDLQVCLSPSLLLLAGWFKLTPSAAKLS